MLRWPALICGGNQWHLPLSVRSARGLLSALLAPEIEHRDRLQQILADDPALCLYAVCRAWRTKHCFTSLSDGAVWLEQNLLTLLHELPSDPAPAAGGLSSYLDWERLLIACFACARLASQDSSSSTYLLALLHNASAWLDRCGPGLSSADVDSGQSPLPAWLVDRLVQLQNGQCHLEATQAVRSAAIALESCDAQATQPALLWATQQAKLWLETGDAAELWWQLGRAAQLRRRLAQLESDFQHTLETEKLAAMRQLAYGASHEINNPLANISTRAQTLLRDETDPERRRKLATINSQAFRAHEMISDLMLFVRPAELHRQMFDGGELVEQVLGELRDEADQQGTSLKQIRPRQPVEIYGDRDQLAVVLKNLCRNALEALRVAGQVEVEIGTTKENQASDWIELQVRDNGPGISSEVRRHLFDPFYSGREAGRGLGLGLSKCWRIVTEHGGRIDVHSEPGYGSTFSVRLPQPDTMVAPQAA